MNSIQTIQALINLCDPVELSRLVANYGYSNLPITPYLLNDIYLADSDFAQDFAAMVDSNAPWLNSWDGSNLTLTNGSSALPGGSSNVGGSSGSGAKFTPSDINTTIDTVTNFVTDMFGFFKTDNSRYAADTARANADAEKARTEREKYETPNSSIPWVWIVIGVFVVIVIALYYSNRKK